MSPYSKIGLSERGKVPGYHGAFGWRSFDWVGAEITPAQVAQWAAGSPEAGVGLRAGRFPAVDIDITDDFLAGLVESVALKTFGPAPLRVGAAPRRLLAYRLADGQEPISKIRLWFDDKNGARHLIEVLGSDSFYVVDGIHKKTGRPYTWDRDPVSAGAGALAPITREQVEAFLFEVKSLLEVFDCVEIDREGTGKETGEAVSQEALRAPSIEAVRAAVALMPNPLGTRRSAYRDMGYRIKASLPDDPEDAYAIFEDWALLWEGEDNHEKIRADWDRMKPPFRIGWSSLREVAGQHGFVSEDQFDTLTGLPVKEPAPPVAAPDEIVEAGPVVETIEVADPADAPAEAPQEPVEAEAPAEEKKRYAPVPQMLPLGAKASDLPLRPWILGRRFLAGAVTAGVGAPGVSKSTMSLLAALAIATGRELTGEKVHRREAPRPVDEFVGPMPVGCKVWIHNNEDDEIEIKRRLLGMCQHYGIDPDEIREKVLFSSGVVQKLRLAIKHQDEVKRTKATDELVEDIRAHGVVFMAMDPFVSVHSGVSENSNDEVETVISYIRNIASQTGCAIDLVHHSVKNHSGNTESRAGDANTARGASALIGAVRSSYTLAPMAEETAEKIGIPPDIAAGLVRMDSAKGNYSARSFEPVWFRLVSVDLGNGGEDLRDEGDSVGVPELFDLKELAEQEQQRREEAGRYAVQDVLQVVAKAFPGARCPLTGVVPAVMKAIDRGDTQARDAIKKAIGSKTEISVDGIRVELALVPSASHKNAPLIITRRVIG